MPTPMLRSTRRRFLSGLAVTLAAPSARSEASKNALRILEARPIEGAALGFDGVVPGPVLRYRQGDELALRFVNKLDEPATIHFQGLRGDSDMDGVAPLTQPAVAPGGSFDYRRRLNDPGLFCYRPSVYGRTPELMRRGLKGLLIVDEAELLPCDREILLVLDDDGAGAITVNGAPAPMSVEERPGARLRLRIANLSCARIMIARFERVQPFVIAIDGQPCEAFEPVRKSIPVAPGARFELMFDMPKIEGETGRMFLLGPDDAETDLVLAAAKGALAAGRGLIYSLPPNPGLPAEIKLAESKKVNLAIAGTGGAKGAASWTINGATGGYQGKPLFRVNKNTPVTLGFVNRTDAPLAMHVHGHALRLLHDLDDGWEPYWRNGVIVPPASAKHVAFIAETPGKWAIHDDIVDRESAGLATWFETV